MKLKLIILLLLLTGVISTKQNKTNQIQNEDRENQENGKSREKKPTKLLEKKISKIKQFSLKRFLNFNREKNETCKSRWYARHLPANCVPNDAMFREKFKQHCCLPNAIVAVKSSYLQKYRAKYTEDDGFLPRAFKKTVKNQQILCYTATTNKAFLNDNYQDKLFDLHGYEFQLALCPICKDSNDVYLTCDNNHIFCQACLDNVVLHSMDREIQGTVGCPMRCEGGFAKSYEKIQTERYSGFWSLLNPRRNPHGFTTIALATFGWSTPMLIFLELSKVLLPEKLLFLQGATCGIFAALVYGIVCKYFICQRKIVDYFYGPHTTPYQMKQIMTKFKNLLDRFVPAKVNFAILILALIMEVYFIMEGYLTFYFFCFATIPLAMRIFLP